MLGVGNLPVHNSGAGEIVVGGGEAVPVLLLVLLVGEVVPTTTHDETFP